MLKRVITGFKNNWITPNKVSATPKQSQEAPKVAYQDAVSLFQSSLEHVKAYDVTEFDTDQRPGEVKVGGLGQLQSNETGFDLHVMSANEDGIEPRTPGSDGVSRSYSVNESNGTIAVFVSSDIGESRSKEKYTIDTRSESIKDYSKDERNKNERSTNFGEVFFSHQVEVNEARAKALSPVLNR